MSNEIEIRKLSEMIVDFKRGKLHLKGYEYMALSEYLNSLKDKKKQ